MNPDRARVAMLYQDPHPAHRGFARAVGADLVDYRGRDPAFLGDGLATDAFNGVALPDYDIYIVEGSRPLYTAVINRLTAGSRLVYLCADHGLYALGRGDFEGDSVFKSLVGRFGTSGIKAVGRRSIDGVVAVSEFAAGFTRPIVGENTPIEVVNPYIQPDLYQTLGGVEPDIASNVAVTVGRGDRYKGIDMLVEAWPSVRSVYSGAELHVVGADHPESYDDVEGVHVRGFVEELPDAFEPASLFVQPSRMDTFPVSTLEAMWAGLPPIVSTGAGTRSVAREVDEQLVVDPNPEDIARGVSGYFELSRRQRRLLGARSRRIGGRFDAESQKAAFRAAFRRIVESI